MTGHTEIAHGMVDGDGRLITADPPLAALNERAGGAIGEALAVAPIASLVRLARRLRVLVSRGVVVADDGRDLDLWVRASPVSDGVRLSIVGWRPRDAWRSDEAEAVRSIDFVRAAADWHWETDASLRLTAISANGATRHGLDRDKLLGAALTQLFALVEDDAGNLPILDAVANRRGFERQDARVRSDGAAATLSAAVRTDPQGAFAGFVGGVCVGDGAEVAGASPGLTEAFSRGLDQALRAPLGRIIAGADSIHARTEGPLRQDYADYAADIASAGRHLLDLIDDLADLQAIERADFAPTLELIDLADVARRAAGLLSVRAGDARVTIDRPAMSETAPVVGDFRRALQVMVNLVGNAVRYSPPGGTVWIRIDRDGDRALVIVADQGKGIAAADQARVFEKFERVDPSEPGGNGLGLYIARRLARAMAGDLTVDSAPGEGARFLFALPRG